jgi:hypothetical protein
VLIGGTSTDLVGELINRRERLVKNEVKELADRHAAHEGGEPQPPVHGFADACGQPDV